MDGLLVVNEAKYIEVLEYLLGEESGANNLFLGKVKLMKLLYFADFDHYFNHGTSITEDTYVKLDFGPVPQNADRILEKMAREKQLTVEKVPNAVGYRNEYTLCESRSSGTSLSPAERETLAAVVTRWRNSTTADIVAASHGDPPWRMVKYGEVIPYHLVYYRKHSAPRYDEEPPIQSMRLL